MDAEFRTRVLALNALALGWALALMGVLLNVVWALHHGSDSFVWYAGMSVMALAFAYFSEIAHLNAMPAVGRGLYLWSAMFVTGSLAGWLVKALVSN